MIGSGGASKEVKTTYHLFPALEMMLVYMCGAL